MKRFNKTLVSLFIFLNLNIAATEYSYQLVTLISESSETSVFKDQEDLMWQGYGALLKVWENTLQQHNTSRCRRFILAGLKQFSQSYNEIENAASEPIFKEVEVVEVGTINTRIIRDRRNTWIDGFESFRSTILKKDNPTTKFLKEIGVRIKIAEERKR